MGPPYGKLSISSHTIPMSLGILMGVVWERGPSPRIGGP